MPSYCYNFFFFWFPIRYPGLRPDYSGLDQLWRTRMVGGSPNEDCCVHKVSNSRSCLSWNKPLAT
ncbi:hypothetical protein SLEP1_g23225 [Rubroshorea leprosula]|uniref:Uncharacterized protein n=1 Tax=Rubroshorea leprosula TaxID=152421 RepID=A0AAV5JBW0_9ROSI|nr:hypothetical protein SLEP1_g23225 [Rubroshorea leprosula]